MEFSSEMNSDGVTLCPWCLERFESYREWAEAFEENHPIVSWINDRIGILSTPVGNYEYDHLWECQRCDKQWWYDSDDSLDRAPLHCPNCLYCDWEYLGQKTRWE